MARVAVGADAIDLVHLGGVGVEHAHSKPLFESIRDTSHYEPRLSGPQSRPASVHDYKLP